MTDTPIEQDVTLGSMIASSRTRLLGAVFTLIAIGLVMVYSASAVRASRYGWDIVYMKRQCLWLVIGLFGFGIASFTPVRWLRRLWPLIALGSIGLLVAVRIPGLGTKVNGAYRWIRLAGYNMQPSELAKLAMVVVVAALLARFASSNLPFWKGFLPTCLVIGLTSGLVMVEPDFGTAALIGSVLMAMLLVGGARLWHIAGGLALAIPPAVYVGIHNFDHIVKRVHEWLDGSCWQVEQSKIALSSGGVYGMGLGEGPSKYFFLPEAHTDFILAVLGQEFGLLGTLTIVALFGMILFEGYRLAQVTRDRFQAYVVFGIITMIGSQALFNFAVVTGSIPPKGISLPFVSFGGSGLCIALTAIGIVVSVSRQVQREAVANALLVETPSDAEITALPPYTLSQDAA